MSSRSSGVSATRCAMTASITATTSSRSPICSSSRWRTSGAIDLSRIAVPAEAAAAIDCSWPALAARSGAALTRPLHRRAAHARPAAGPAGRHLRRRRVALQQPGEPEAADRSDRRDGVDGAGGGRQGRGLRGAAGEGGERGEEGRRAVLHAAPADPVDRALRAARSARARRTSRSAIRPAAPAASWSSPTSGCWPRRARTAREPELARAGAARHLLRPGAGAAPAAAGADEPLPARPGAGDQARRLDLRAARAGRRFDVVLTNPPFGNKGANQVPARDDFAVKTSNKQLNFLQHVLTLLKPGGRAAVIVPDNCLFADQAGEVFKMLTAGLRPAHGAAPAQRHVHPVQRRHQDQRGLLHQGAADGDGLGLRRAHQRAADHQEGPPADPCPLRRLRGLLRPRPQRPRPARGRRLARRTAGARSRSPRCGPATSRSTASSGSRRSRSTRTSCPSPRSWRRTRSPSWRARWTSSRVGHRAAGRATPSRSGPRVAPGRLMTSAVSDWEIGRREGRAAGRLGRGDARGDRRPRPRRRVGRGSARGGGEPGAGAGAGDPRHRVPRLGARQGRDGGGAGDQAHEPRPPAARGGRPGGRDLGRRRRPAGGAHAADRRGGAPARRRRAADLLQLLPPDAAPPRGRSRLRPPGALLHYLCGGFDEHQTQTTNLRNLDFSTLPLRRRPAACRRSPSRRGSSRRRGSCWRRCGAPARGSAGLPEILRRFRQSVLAARLLGQADRGLARAAQASTSRSPPRLARAFAARGEAYEMARGEAEAFDRRAPRRPKNLAATALGGAGAAGGSARCRRGGAWSPCRT